MRYSEIIMDDIPSTLSTLSTSLANQAKIKSTQAKKLKQQASIQKKREQVNGARSSLLKKQGDLMNTISNIK